MPTHGFTAPWPMIRFSLRLPPGNGTHAFVVPTRAGLKLGRLYTPGMEGTAGYLIALILFLKGYSIRGVMGLDMPSNWLSLHPGLKPGSVAGIIHRAKKKGTRFMETIVAGDRHFPMGSIVQLLFGLLLLPISIGYLLVGRFFLAKLFFANYHCNGCGICVDNCPNRAVRMWGTKNPRPYWTFSCESCMRCMGYCPKKAVEAGHSLGLLLYFITSIPVGVFFLNMLGQRLPGVADLSHTWVNWLLQYPYILLSMYLCYLLVTLLIRISIINKVFTWTTFTRIWRRYREPETTLKEIRVWDSRFTEEEHELPTEKGGDMC
jgi:ferredoxin